MANEVELQIVLKLLDQATGDLKNAMGRIKGDADQVGQAGAKAGKSIRDQFRAANTQIRDIRRSFFVLGFVVAAMVKTVSDFSKKNSDAAHALSVMKQAIVSISENIGSLLAPAFINLGKEIEKATPKVDRFFDNIRTKSQNAFRWISEKWQKLVAIDAYLTARADKSGRLDIRGALSAADVVSKLASADMTAAMERQQNKLQQYNTTLRDGWKEGLDAVMADLRDFANMSKTIMTDSAKNMQTMFSDLFFNVFTNDITSAKAVFEDFGKSIVRTFSNAMAQMVTYWLWMKVTTGIGSLFGHFTGIGGTTVQTGPQSIAGRSFTTAYAAPIKTPYMHMGGIIKAHSGLALDEVPIIAKSGERVLSREQNRDYERGGKGGLTINVNPVIQLWDASDVSRNNRTLVNAINEAIINNQAIRRVIRDYA